MTHREKFRVVMVVVAAIALLESVALVTHSDGVFFANAMGLMGTALGYVFGQTPKPPDATNKEPAK